LSWGTAAEEIHDIIDNIIETGDKEWLQIITTAHQDEDFKDVAWFFLNATYFESGSFRCMAILDENIHENSILCNQLLEVQTDKKINGDGSRLKA